MSSEALLENPLLFSDGHDATEALNHDVAKAFLAVVRRVGATEINRPKNCGVSQDRDEDGVTREARGSCKAHLFKIMFGSLQRPGNEDMRAALGTATALSEMERVVAEVGARNVAAIALGESEDRFRPSSGAWYGRHDRARGRFYTS
jgi:hypothetical protein